MSANTDCIFCKIIAGDVPSFKLYEDDATLSFMDINPAGAGHVLVIPKEHAADVHAVSDSAIAAVALAAKKVATAVQKALKPEGINLVQSNGAAAAQSVMHFHMHVLPRQNGDELKLNWGLVPGDMDVIGKLADRIRSNI